MPKTNLTASALRTIALGLGMLSLTTLACGERAAEETPKKQPAAIAETGEKAASEQPTLPGVAADDPLLGKWVVVKVVGRFEVANTGLEYDFRPDGTAHTLKYLDPGVRPERTRTANEPPPKEGDVKKNIWSWKRIGPDQIELNHKDSPMTASIKTTIADDTMEFVWNETGSVFTMERIK